ncbi:Tic22-like protein [Tribonema minus]|uniref:Tic22-like protein n=1 Tax=Tribonema minus TaxID=303371 RepID=A0A835Z8Y7_9STRA|nr:Tic22-like protein [Tribonema minus]
MAAPDQQPQHTPQRRLRLKKRLAQVAAGFAVATAGAPALSQGIRSGHSTSGQVLSEVLMPSAEASVFKKFNQRTLKEKLANVPAFAIVNRGGNFYLNIKETGGQQGMFFTSFEDANDMLFEMLQSPGLNGDARILIIPLDKAFDMIKHPRATGMVNDMGQPETIEFRFHEAVHPREKMELYRVQDKQGAAVPVFYAGGLTIVKEGVKVKPVFFDVKELLDAWFKAAKTDPNMPRVPDIQVYNLPELLLLMESDPTKHTDFGFVPAGSSVEAIKEVRGQHGTRARPMYRLFSY